MKELNLQLPLSKHFKIEVDGLKYEGVLNIQHNEETIKQLVENELNKLRVPLDKLVVK